MKKATKIWLIAAACLVAVGGVLFAAAASMAGGDISKLSSAKYETNTHGIDEDFSGISMLTETADIEFIPSPDGKCTVKCYEAEDARHSVAVENDTLVIKLDEQSSRKSYIGFNVESPKITVYLPTAEYEELSIVESTGNVDIPKAFSFQSIDISSSTGSIELSSSAAGLIKIAASTGDIDVEDISAGELDLSVTTGEVEVSNVSCAGDITLGVSTGKAELSDVRCKSLRSSGTTGDISLSNVIAEQSFSIDRSTGYVEFDECDAAGIYVETDTGDITGSLLSGKAFTVQTDTGDVDVPHTASGGRCELSSDTGDIKIEIDRDLD